MPQAIPVPGYATDKHSPLTMGHQHHPPYGVLAYIQVSTYPPHVPPAAHMYHSGPLNRRPPPSRSPHSMVTQSTHNFPSQRSIAHRTRNSKWMLSILSYPPTPPHGYSLISGRRRLGILHGPRQSGILHRRRHVIYDDDKNLVRAHRPEDGFCF